MRTSLLDAVLAVTSALSGPIGHEEVVRILLSAVSSSLGAERASLYRPEPSGDLVAHASIPGVHGVRLPSGAGLAGWVAAFHTPARTNDPASDPRFLKSVDQKTGFHTRSVLAVPLLDAKGELVGVLQALNKPGGFDDDDEKLLVGLAPACVMAIANADLVASLAARNDELDRAMARARRQNEEVGALADLERELLAARDEGLVLHAALDFLVRRYPTQDASALIRGERNHVVAARPDLAGGPVRLRVRRISKQWADTLLQTFEEPTLAGGRQLSAPIEVDGEPIGALQLLVDDGADGPGAAWIEFVAEAAGRAIGGLREQSRAARDDRLALVGQMMGGILHDLRNPLSALRGYLEILVDEPDPAEREEVVARALTAVTALDAMSQEVLEFTRGASRLDVHAHDAAAFLSDLAELAGPDVRRFGTELSTSADGEIALRADASRLRRVLANLVRNAGEAGATRVDVAARRDGDTVVIEVTDDGPGIHADIRDRLFQPFATFGKSGGTGLGLAMARQVVESHGGRMEAPAVARGAVFRITLPA